jgi:5-methylcytosine-specific restriction endonuclease McrA
VTPPLTPASIRPITADLRVLRVTVSAEFVAELEEVRAVLSHQHPEGRFEDIVRECFKAFLERRARRRGALPPMTADAGGNAAATFAGATRATPATTSAPPSTKIRAEVEKRALPTATRSASPVPATHDARAEVPPPVVTRSRYIPAAIAREVWARDGGRCTFRGTDGRVCGSRYQVELDHVHPWALGGPTTTASLRLACRAHNQWRARQTFGCCVGAGSVRRGEGDRSRAMPAGGSSKAVTSTVEPTNGVCRSAPAAPPAARRARGGVDST